MMGHFVCQHILFYTGNKIIWGSEKHYFICVLVPLTCNAFVGLPAEGLFSVSNGLDLLLFCNTKYFRSSVLELFTHILFKGALRDLCLLKTDSLWILKNV